jgi:hypothetical protein
MQRECIEVSEIFGTLLKTGWPGGWVAGWLVC